MAFGNDRVSPARLAKFGFWWHKNATKAEDSLKEVWGVILQPVFTQLLAPWVGCVYQNSGAVFAPVPSQSCWSSASWHTMYWALSLIIFPLFTCVSYAIMVDRKWLEKMLLAINISTNYKDTTSGPLWDRLCGTSCRLRPCAKMNRTDDDGDDVRKYCTLRISVTSKAKVDRTIVRRSYSTLIRRTVTKTNGPDDTNQTDVAARTSTVYACCTHAAGTDTGDTDDNAHTI